MNQLSRKLFIITLLCTSYALYSDMDFESFFDTPDVEHLLNTTTFAAPGSRAPIPVETLVPLLEQLGLVSLLEEPFYKYTYPLNKRYILDLPLFTFPWHHCQCKEFGFQIFYNATNRMAFKNNCTNISSYLNITGNGFIEKLQNFIEAVQGAIPDFDPELPIEILSLVENFTVQERNLGIMFDGEQKLNEWRFRWFLPVYYKERNHFVNPEVEDEITRITEQLSGSRGDCDAQWQFAREHLIADRLGIGDFRIEFDAPVYDTECYKARIGFLVDFPVSFSFARGLLGNKFYPPCPRPTLNLEEVLDDEFALEDIAETELANYFIQALDNLSNMLLSTGLGHDGHMGIGVITRTKSHLSKFISRPWAEPIYFLSRMSIEYLIPTTKLRPFALKDNLADFTSRDFTSSNPIIAQENYNFLVQTLTNKLFPPYYYARIWPGIVLRSTTRAVWEDDVWGAYVGMDSWLRTGETIATLEISNNQFNKLKVSEGERPLAYQAKLFGGIAKRICMIKDRELTLSLNADTTYVASGIGNDFTITFNIDFNF